VRILARTLKHWRTLLVYRIVPLYRIAWYVFSFRLSKILVGINTPVQNYDSGYMLSLVIGYSFLGDELTSLSFLCMYALEA
jgi:hypothetical protein